MPERLVHPLMVFVIAVAVQGGASASPSPDRYAWYQRSSVDLWRHPIVLAVIDKVLLGLVALAFGFWLQRRLERHKRNEALTSEVAKLRIAAYYRVLDEVGAVRRDLMRYEPTYEYVSKTYDRSYEVLLAAVAQQHLLNDSFVHSVRQFGIAVEYYLFGAGLEQPPGSAPFRAAVVERLAEIAETLPQFVRLPETEDFFKLPPAAPARRS